MSRVPPFIPFTLVFMAGILVDVFFRANLFWPAAFIVAGLTWTAWRTEGILLLALGFGMLIGHVHRVPYSAGDVRNVIGERPAYFECIGRITGDPIPRTGARQDRLDFPLRLEFFSDASGRRGRSGDIWVEWRRDPKRAAQAPRLFWGDRVWLSGYLDRPAPATNPYLFDYRDYLETRGLHHVLTIDPDDPPLEKLGAIPGLSWIFRARDRLEKAVLRGISGPPEVEGLLLGMILGERSEMPQEVSDNFRKTGTLHVVAISGLHITLIAFLITMILRMFRIKKSLITFIVIPLLLAYVVMTGFRPSAVRALVMCVVFLGSWMLNRPAHMMNSLAVAAFAILAFAPGEIFDPGFQLSFLVVAAIVLLAPRIKRKIEAWTEADPYLPQEFVSPARRRIGWTLGWAADLVSVSLAAWIGSAGLILYYFHLFSPVSFFCNLVVVPLSGLSLALGFTAMLADLFWPALASLFNQTQWLGTQAMLGVTDAVADWSWGYVYVAQPAAWLVAAGYALGCAALFWKRSRLWVAAVAAVCAAAFVGWGYASRPVEITVLDVANGQAVFMERFGGPKILIDAGSESQGRSVVEPFLRARGVNRLDMAVASHGDATHVGGLIEILKKFPVGELVINPAKTRSSKYKKLLKEAQEHGVKWVTVKAGDTLQCGGIEMEVLWPREPFRPKADENSLVLRYGDLLFLSDLPEQFEAEVVRQGRMTVVRGTSSRECFSGPLLASTQRVIFSSTDRERNDLVLPATLDRLQGREVGVWVTGLHGAVSLLGRPNGWTVRPFRSLPEPGQ